MRSNIIAHNPYIRCVMATLLSAGAVASQADCTQADLAGTWHVSSLSTVTVDPATNFEASFTSFCKLKVNSAGIFSKTTTVCDSSSGRTTVEGAMKVAGTTCNVMPFPMKVFANGVQIFTFTVDYMTLDKNKTTFTATGNKGAAVTGMPQFIWQGVKR